MDAIWCYGWLLKLMASAQSLTFPFASAQGPSPAGKWPLFSWACSWVWRNFITVGLHLILHSISLEGNETHHGSMDQWCSSDLSVANLTEPLIRASNKRRFSAARRSNSWRWVIVTGLEGSKTLAMAVSSSSCSRRFTSGARPGLELRSNYWNEIVELWQHTAKEKAKQSSASAREVANTCNISTYATYVYNCIHVCICIYIYDNICIHMYVITYVYVYMCMYMYVYIYIHTWEGGNESQSSCSEFNVK